MIDKDKYITYCGMDVSEYLDKNCEYNVGDDGECPFMVFPCLARNPWFDSVSVKIDATSTSNKTKILNRSDGIAEIEIDGAVQPNVITSYTFNTLGEHTVRYLLEDPSTIKSSAFFTCSDIKSVKFPETLTFIGNGAFGGCAKLTEIELPTKNELIIEGGAFGGCGITSLVVPNNVVLPQGHTGEFSSNPIKTLVWDTNNVTSNYPVQAYITYGSLESITYGENITIINSASVAGAPKLTSVTISDGVKEIGPNAFASCSKLVEVNIPYSVEKILYGAFQGCSSLRDLTIPSSVTTIENSAFAGFNSLETLNYNAQVSLSSSFLGAFGVKNVIIGDNVPSIGDSVFNRVISLTGLTIGNSVTSIGSYAFLQCRLNGSLIIPDSVTNIGVNAFNGCAYLTDIIIGTGITSIDGMAFNNCGGLTEITINAATPPTLGNYVFANTNECPIYVPTESVNAYKTASGWGEYADRIHSI